MSATSENEEKLIVEDCLKIEEFKIGYCRYGHGKTNLILIPGAVGCYARDFPSSVLRAFDPGLVTVVAIDPPGYGKSRPPDRKQEVARCMKDAKVVIKLMQTLELTPFVVLGWSEGGRTAIHVANQGKAQVCGLVLQGSITVIDSRANTIYAGLKNFDQWLPAMRDSYLAHYDESFIREQWSSIGDLSNEVYTHGGRLPSDYVLSKIKQPVLLLHGANDTLGMPPQHFCDKMPQAELVVHKTGGHDFHLKDPKFFADAVQEFLVEKCA